MSTDDPTHGTTGEAPDVRDLLGAYALDAVDDVERRAVERLVASDPDAARELAGLTATAALLGSAVSAPAPAEVRASVLDLVRVTRQESARPATASAHTPGGPSSSVEPGVATAPQPHEPGHVPEVTSLDSRRVPRRRLWLAVAATAIGAAAVPSTIAWQQAQEARRADHDAQVMAEMLADPDALMVHADVEGGGTAVAVLGDDQALFMASGLGDPGDGMEYQLWVVRDGVALPDATMPERAGHLSVMTEDFAPGDALAVTVEPRGGSEQPTTDPIVVLAASEA